MSVLDQAQRLVAAGRRADGVALVERAAEAGDVEALFALANWRLFALFGPRDLGEAHRLLDRAAGLGSVEAVRTKAALTANGTGCEADMTRAEVLLEGIRARDGHAALQLTFAGMMAPSTGAPPEASEVLGRAPVIKLYRTLLSPQECGYLREMARPSLQASFVTNPTTGARMPHPIRTSMGTSFGPTQEDIIIRRINERIAWVSGTDVACGEPLHILRYERGQEYRPHTDSMAGDANPRAWTMLIYLSDGYQGGATQFPRLGISVTGAVGDALLFGNVDADGRPHPDSLHAGQPVGGGEKWLATRWIRARPYHPWLG